MTLADPPTPMASMTPITLQNVHPGGFFWNVDRGERASTLRRLATEATQLAVIASSDVEANDFSERLTLAGMPVVLATDTARSGNVGNVLADGMSTLVATHDYVVSHGPIRVPMAVHLRVPASVRNYSRRLEAVPSAAHVTLVIPEDRDRAETLQNYLRTDKGHETVVDVTVKEVIDLTDTDGSPAARVNGRRRFPLRH